MLNIVFSYDYELFLGKNFKSSKEILFEPTERILSLLDKYNIKSTCFADVCSVFAHEKYNLNEFKEDFENQIQSIIERGHDVQLHIHPNWLLSEYKDGQWEIEKEHYKIHRFGFDKTKENNAYEIITKGKEYLENVLQRVNKDYKCVAYRAGGYSVLPHDELFAHMRSLGIVVDSSVCRYAYDPSVDTGYDFRKMPNDVNWWVTPNKPFDYCGNKEDGGLYEVPLVIDNNKWYKMLDRKYLRIIRNSPINGTYISTKKKHSRLVELAIKVIKYPFKSTLVSFDGMAYERMVDYLIKYEKEHNNAIIALICHPKVLDDGVLDNMDKALNILSKDNRFNFMTMADVAKGINNNE